MGKNMKFVVTLGAVLALAGAFMPVAKGVADMKAAAEAAMGAMKDAAGARAIKIPERFGGGGILSKLPDSVFDFRNLGGPGPAFAYGLLGAGGLILLFGLLGIAKGFGRGFAAGAFVFSIVPTALGLMLVFAANERGGGAGMGSYLVLAGGALALIGGLLTLIKPEVKTA